MTQLRAFVGHSFTEEDEALVRTFLKFFDQVKDMGIGFFWEHAEPAEPKVLAEKVLGLISDKNLFIGICTKKEGAIHPSRLKRGVIRKKILKADESHFAWKTSDWIIQEIGIAIGRDMELILLVEDGLRQPGGFQGNLEYIPFDRQSPEKSFGKVLEMIRALLPRAKALGVEEADIRTIPGEKPRSQEDKSDEWLKPRGDWERANYEVALIVMIDRDNQEGVRKISDAYFASTEGQIPENRESWEAYREYLRLAFGKGGKLKTLEELAKSHYENSEVQRYIALGYREYEEYEKAARKFEIAAEKAGSDNLLQLVRYGDAASAFVRAGKRLDAQAVIKKMKQLALLVENGEALLIATLREIAEVDNDKDMFFGLTERLLNLRPDDVKSRFSLAYEYSQSSRDDLSLFHYLRIPYQERGAGTWNNLGVEYDHLNLESKSVGAYRKAEELAETLAMSNLAQKLINEGFLSEAEEICNRAVKIENYHKNIGHTISRIKDIPEAENKKEKDILGKATPLSEFYRDYGHAIVKSEPNDHSGMWTGPHCRLQVNIKGGKFKAEGNYESQSLLDALSSVKLGTASLVQPPKSTRYIIRYEGIVTGFAVKGNVIVEQVDGPAKSSTLLGDTPTPKEVLMIIADDLSEIRVYEKDAIESLRFYSIKRIEE